MLFSPRGLEQVRVSLSWDFNLHNEEVDNYDFDLDLSCIMENTKTCELNTVSIKLNKPNYEHNVIRLHKDNFTGFGKSDEILDIDFKRLPEAYDKLSVLVNIHKAEIRATYFGEIPHIKLNVNKGGFNIYSCNISSKYPNCNAVIPVYFVKNPKSGKWSTKTKSTVLHGDKITQVLIDYENLNAYKK